MEEEPYLGYALALLGGACIGLAWTMFRRARGDTVTLPAAGLPSATSPQRTISAAAGRVLDIPEIALSRLSRNERRALLFRNVTGLSFAEIGGRLGLSADEARTLTTAALQHFRSESVRADVATTRR